MSNPQPKEKFLTKAEVLKRGWTVASIRQILGSPDKNSRNPAYRSAPPVQLFELKRVEEAERSPQFLDWEQKSSKKRMSARLAAKRKKETIDTERERVSQAWEKLSPLSQWRTADWTDFTWKSFHIESIEISERETKIAVKAVCRMLQRSHWIPVKLLFEAFAHYGMDCVNTDEKVAELTDRIAAEGWRGIPLVTFFAREDDAGRPFLESGHHRWLALKKLLDSGKISEQFRVPVFDLRETPECFNAEEYKEKAIFGLALLEKGQWRPCCKQFSSYGSEGDFILGLCTGIDC